MPVTPPVLVTRAHVGKGPGIVLISLAAPAGELGKGPVDNVEVIRLAMTYSTFKEVAELFDRTLAELNLGADAAAMPHVIDNKHERFVRGTRPHTRLKEN
jgi:hypothetical protein